MEGLKTVAINSYNGWTEEEKKKAKAFFRKIDDNEDGKVTYKELRDYGLITNSSCLKFDQFDIDTDGVLDFNEILVMYFYKYKTGQLLKKYKPGKRRCKRCDVKQRLPDYSCFFCLDKGKRKSYNLCESCNSHGDEHEHEQWGMLNQKSLALLKVLAEVLDEVEKEVKRMGKMGKFNTGVAVAGTTSQVTGMSAKAFCDSSPSCGIQ